MSTIACVDVIMHVDPKTKSCVEFSAGFGSPAVGVAGFVLDTFSGDLPSPSPTWSSIASRLYPSVKTIESRVSAVVRKLQLSNRHQLTAWANERRLI